MTRLEHAEQLLAVLNGATLPPRPQEPRRVLQRLCRNAGCNVQITIAHLPTGAWCALDSHPNGDMVILNATVRARGEIHADAPRYCFHRCGKDSR